MSHDTRALIGRCIELETLAHRIYLDLSVRAPNLELREFWRTMSAEESGHIAFWQEIQSLAREGVIPEIVERPKEVSAELDRVLETAKRLGDDLRSRDDVAGGFTQALNLEMHLMHPAFEAFFLFAKSFAGAGNPSDDYDRHLDRFLDAAARYGNPDAELLRHTILHMWRQNRELARLSFIDGLTGILNRRGLMHTITTLSHLAKRSGTAVGIFMADVDNFKSVNDRYGHAEGDRVLSTVSAVLKSLLRHSDVVGRYGGEEFLAFLNPVEPGFLRELGEGMCARVAEETARTTPVTISIGAASGTIECDPEVVVADLTAAADRALYEAKSAGRNRVVISNERSVTNHENNNGTGGPERCRDREAGREVLSRAR